MSVLVRLDSLGTVHSYTLGESIIRSDKRFTYQEVQKILEGQKGPHAKMLHQLQLLSAVLQNLRKQKGSIDFDFPEQHIELDEEGIPRTIGSKEQMESQRLVAEFMLLANRLVAETIFTGQKQLPFLYRVHEQPKEEDVRALTGVLDNLNIPYRMEEPVTPDDYRNILAIIQNLDFRDFVEKIAFRSMTKADYRTENTGHFGLSFQTYTHFTSPIRRYADLTVHRLLKRYAPPQTFNKETTDANSGNFPAGSVQASALQSASGRDKKAAQILTRKLDEIGAACSRQERVAVAAEREYTKIKSMEFLSNKIGHVYDGVITGVTSFGIFVELSRYLIEGLVHVSEMKDDFYRFDEENYRYVGEKRGGSYRLGDQIRVKIKNVSPEDRRADFSFG